MWEYLDVQKALTIYNVCSFKWWICYTDLSIKCIPMMAHIDVFGQLPVIVPLKIT